MKHITMIALAGALLATAVSAQTTAYSKPSGFVTHTLKAGQFNLIGLTLHEPVTVSGIFETVSGTSLTDNDVNFGSTLTAGKTYILEITENTADPSMVGVIQEITSWSDNKLTTPADLGTDGLAAGAKYQLRAAKTIADVFGENNEAGLLAGASGTADMIWLSIGGGAYKKYYYSDGSGFGVDVGWRLIGGGNADQAFAVLSYLDPFFIQCRDTTDKDLTIVGAVKSVETSIALTNTFNYIGGVYPVGSTLANSGLEHYLLQGASGTADVIWIPISDGGYLKYYYSDGSGFGVTQGWRRIGGGDTDAKDDPFASGMIIQRRAESPYNAKIDPPTSWGL